MWKSILILCISFSGCLAILETCSADRCQKLAPPVDMENPDHLFPSVERLEAVCPAIRVAFDCILEEFSKCADQDLDEMATSDNETLVAASGIILGTKNLMDDLCDSTTQIHKAYARNIGCIRDTMMAPMTMPLCAFEAKGLYGTYKFGEEEDEREHHCIVAAHVFACISGDVLEQCGEEARATLVELLKRTKVLKYGVCTPQSILDLKTKYIEFLALESERRIIFEKVFDMKKRRK
uniref:Secreted protein n=1 Tax=Parasteatoda tepidariorum TaxID=114398 RepID=A0A2L2Y4P9_PARTP